MLCTYCGFSNAEDGEHCQRCGQPLPAAAPAPASSAPSAAGPTDQSEQPQRAAGDAERANKEQPAASPKPPVVSQSTQAPAASMDSPRPATTSATPPRSYSGLASTSREWPLRTLVAMGVIPLRRDQATLAMLGGCAACLLGFFLPWVELQGFDPLLPAQFMLNGTSIGLMTWLLLLLVLLQAVQLLGEPWLLKNNPRLIVWLPAAPLITGSFTLALAIYTLGIYFRLVGLLDLETLSGATPGSSVLAIRIGPGPYLILIGSLVILLAGFYRLAQLLLQARFPR